MVFFYLVQYTDIKRFNLWNGFYTRNRGKYEISDEIWIYKAYIHMWEKSIISIKRIKKRQQKYNKLKNVYILGEIVEKKYAYFITIPKT